MNRILITGCNGFVAPHFVAYLKEHQSEVKIMGVDVSDTCAIKDLNYFQMNLLDMDSIKQVLCDFRPTHIAHFASVSSVSQSWNMPVESFVNNTNIFLNIAESIRKLDIHPRLLSVGSSEEYGNYDQSDLPLREHYELRPCNPYAIARVAQEMLSKLYADSYGLEIFMTRSFNHIGPGQKDVFAIPSFIHQMLLAKREGHNSIHVGNVDIIRDFLDVRDVVDAYYKILFGGKKGEVYNVCRGIGYSLREVINLIGEILNFKPALIVDAAKVRKADNLVIIGDASKLSTELQWTPVYSLEDSLRHLITVKELNG
jgi:GDP-4-dehydro-6-deoxy-D-mannose reductase